MKPYPIILCVMVLCSCATWSKTDKALLTASWLASGADYYTTTKILDNGGYEMNPLIGEHPSNEKLMMYMISSQVIVTLVAHFFPKYRKVLLGGKTIVNTGCAIHNSGE